MYRRIAIPTMLSMVLSGLLFSTAVAAPRGLLGVQAEYQIVATQTDSAGDLVSSREIRVVSTVTNVTADRAQVREVSTEGDTATATEFDVPLAVLRREAPESARPAEGDTLVDDVTATGGRDSRLTARWDQGWFDDVVTTVTDPSWGSFTLSVDLVSWRGNPESSTASGLWLLPSLAAPNEDVAVIATDASEVAADDVVFAPQASTINEYAFSDFTLRDNPIAKIVVNKSRLSATGYRQGDCFTSWNGSLTTSAPAINWWLALKSVTGSASCINHYARVEGDANFEGVFPLGCSSGWRSHVWHKHLIYAANHKTWLQNTIWDNCNGIWHFWGQRNFYTGGTYGRGTTQAGAWYIVGN